MSEDTHRSNKRAGLFPDNACQIYGRSPLRAAERLQITSLRPSQSRLKYSLPFSASAPVGLPEPASGCVLLQGLGVQIPFWDNPSIPAGFRLPEPATLISTSSGWFPGRRHGHRVRQTAGRLLSVKVQADRPPRSESGIHSADRGRGV